MDIRALESKKTLLNHFKALRRAWRNLTDKVYLDCDSFKVFIHYHEDIIVLYPQFACWDEAQRMQTWEFTDEVQRFLGWRPYGIKSVETFTDKLKFKEWLERQRIKTPQFSPRPTLMVPVLLKHRRSAFGRGVHGPYRTSQDCPAQTMQDYYFEAFIEGKICKLWYWNEKPLCMEIQAMAKLVGNGRDTIKTLITKYTELLNVRVNVQSIEALLIYYGLQINTVLADQQIQLIDFRYGSPLSSPLSTIELDCGPGLQPELLSQLTDIGKRIAGDLLTDNVRPLLYTLDCILTDDHTLWFLEANANPFIHPRCYQVMAAESCRQSQVLG